MKIAILLLSCARTARRTNLTEDWFRLLSGQVRDYFLDQSGGRLACDFAVFDWVELSISGQQWTDAGPAVGDTARAEAAAKYNFSEAGFDHFILVIDDQVSALGVTDYKTDTRIAAVSATPTIFAHELGHALGCSHTQLETREGPKEYGGPFCIMGAEDGKYSLYDQSLQSPEMGSDLGHSASGPGMCIASLNQANWLNTDASCHRLQPYSNGYLGTTIRIAALNGAPPGGSSERVGCLIETYDRFIVEYRHHDNRWDSGLKDRVPSNDGWLVIYRSPQAGASLVALQVATLEVKVGAAVEIDKNPYHLFGASPLRLSVVALDRSARTIDLRVEKKAGKADQYLSVEGILDYLQWPIEKEGYVQHDEPVDQIADGITRLRELRRLERLSGPRGKDSIREAAREQVQELRDLLRRFEI